MRPYRSLSVPANVDELISRLEGLTPDSARQWGTLTPGEMLCHLADAFRTMLGERPVNSALSGVSLTITKWVARHLVKWVALHTSLPWPHGMPTSPTLDPKRDGTKPSEFERDRKEVIDLIRRFVAGDTRYGQHPAFGPMTTSEWLLWGYGHVDHHLRQFSV